MGTLSLSLYQAISDPRLRRIYLQYLHGPRTGGSRRHVDTVQGPTAWLCPCCDGLRMEGGIGDPRSGRICDPPPPAYVASTRCLLFCCGRDRWTALRFRNLTSPVVYSSAMSRSCLYLTHRTWLSSKGTSWRHLSLVDLNRFPDGHFIRQAPAGNTRGQRIPSEKMKRLFGVGEGYVGAPPERSKSARFTNRSMRHPA